MKELALLLIHILDRHTDTLRPKTIRLMHQRSAVLSNISWTIWDGVLWYYSVESTEIWLIKLETKMAVAPPWKLPRPLYWKILRKIGTVLARTKLLKFSFKFWCRLWKDRGNYRIVLNFLGKNLLWSWCLDPVKNTWFWFLTEETLLSLRAPNKEALPSPISLPVLILTHQTYQLTNQL